MLKADKKERRKAPYLISQADGRKEPVMKKNEKPVQETRKQKNPSLATADLETIVAAAEEYVKKGCSYPLFTPGCGCD